MSVIPKRSLAIFGNLFKFSPDEYVHLLGNNADEKVFRLFKTYGDKEYGGGSDSTVSFVSENESSPHNFVRWSGVKNFGMEHAVKSKARGGYVAVKMICDKPIDVIDLDGFLIEMRVKEDLLLTMTMRCRRTLDMLSTHQNNILLKGGPEWQKFFVPFDKLIGTHDGIEKDEDQENDSLQLASFGFMMNSDTWVPGTTSVCNHHSF